MPSRKRSPPSFSDWPRRPINRTLSLSFSLSLLFSFSFSLFFRDPALLARSTVRESASCERHTLLRLYFTSWRLLLASKIKLPMSSSFSKSSRNSSSDSRISTLSTRCSVLPVCESSSKVDHRGGLETVTLSRVTAPPLALRRANFAYNGHPFGKYNGEGWGGRGSTDPDSILRGCGNGDDVRNIAQRIRFPRDYRVAGFLACEWTI